MAHRIEVGAKNLFLDVDEGLALTRPIKVYQVEGDLSENELERISQILTDPVAEVSTIDKPLIENLPQNLLAFEKSLKPGVTDPHGEEARKIFSRTLNKELESVKFSEQYIWKRREMSDVDLRLIRKQLGNPIVNSFRSLTSDQWNGRGFGCEISNINFPTPEAFTYIDLEVDDNSLNRISKEKFLALGLDSMKSIQVLFRDESFLRSRREIGLENKAIDAELEGCGSSWSDHCNHNKFRAKWIYTSEDPEDEANIPDVVDNLLKTLIIEPSRKIMKEKGYMVSAFEDNSGVIKLNENWNISHKVETHNHPSGEDGFGGANTGTGGVFRDPFHTGIGMRVISSQFSFRTAHPNSYADLPLTMQTPSRTLETVILGVEDYGNKIGVPTKSGTVMIDNCWLKPDIYVGATAVQKSEINGRPTHIKDVQPGYIAISLGGRVGKDGIHGASGSSMTHKSDSNENMQLTQSVQIGNPITQKRYFDAALILAEQGLIEASQDCGAGGWHSAVGELAALCNSFEKDRYLIQKAFRDAGINKESDLEDRVRAARSVVDLDLVASPSAQLIKSEVISGEIFRRQSNGKGGVVMDLSDVPQKYAGLEGWEKLISESQERGVIVVKPENVEKVISICSHYDVEATILGSFNNSGFYHVKDQNKSIAFLPIEFLHNGINQMTIRAHWKKQRFEEPQIVEKEDFTKDALELLALPNIQSYNWIFERYDHEVRDGSLIKPIVGRGRGKSDAIADHPVLGEKEVTIETWGSNPWIGDIDPYHMGRNNVVDAIGRVVSAGGNLEKITFNGNTTCPPPESDPLDAAKVIRMIKGSKDAESVFSSPTISGKDSTSMKRSYVSTITGQDVTVKAKPELLMSALAIMPDDSTLITSDFKLPGDRIFIVGETNDELGASEYYRYRGKIGNKLPKSDLNVIKQRYESLVQADNEILVHSAQYLERLGLFYGLANSALGGELGVDIDISRLGWLRADTLLFSESTGRFVVSVHPSKVERFRKVMRGSYIEEIGKVIEDKKFLISYKGKKVIDTNIDQMREMNKGEIRY